jgi:glutaconate CoA-transferase subunit A
MREKVLSLSEAAGWVQNGTLLGFTCQFLENAPMALIREVVRRKTRGLRVATLPGGGLHVDFLIGAGAVEEYEACHCSLGDYGPAPNFQRALRLRSIQMKDST